MLDPEVLAGKLNEMQEQEIFKYLKANGITGDKSKSDSCVIANAFKEQSNVKSEVCDLAIQIHNKKGEVLDYFSPSVSLSSFIRHFDHGCFPELESCVK